jgi:hypothetical protein
MPKPKKPSRKDLHKAAQKLLFALAIYPNYRVDSRGPRGCLLDALDVLDPKAAAKLRDGQDAHDLLDEEG